MKEVTELREELTAVQLDRDKWEHLYAASQREVERLKESDFCGQVLAFQTRELNLLSDIRALQAELDEAKDLLDRIRLAPLDMYDKGICAEIDAFLAAQGGSQTTQVAPADQENVKDHQGE